VRWTLRDTRPAEGCLWPRGRQATRFGCPPLPRATHRVRRSYPRHCECWHQMGTSRSFEAHAVQSRSPSMRDQLAPGPPEETSVR
jgi:hypothetical protein